MECDFYPEEKRNYLYGYRLLNAKISRMREMADMFPKEKGEFENKANEYRERMKKIESDIKRVDDGILSEILFQKYVLGKSLEAISLLLSYSKRQTERLHLSALKKIEAT